MRSENGKIGETNGREKLGNRFGKGNSINEQSWDGLLVFEAIIILIIF